jgi:hypothetical protein
MTPLLVLGVLASAAPSAAQPPQDSCATCHGAFGDERLSGPVKAYPEDVHSQNEFGCVACHGGDASAPGMEAMDPAKGFIGVPSRKEIPLVCSRCHSDADFMRRYNPSMRVDQLAEYRTSFHGHRLFEYDDTLVATCTSCHPAHSIKPPSDPTSSVHPVNVVETCGACHADPERMARYGIPTDQKQQYTESIHWQKLSEEGDLSAPTCNDCHGNHGAAPPGVEWVGNVCGECHTVMAGLFRESFHSEILAMLGRPGCATCHGNHRIVEATDTLLGVGEGSACGQCHDVDSAGGQVAARMRGLVDSLRMALFGADSILAQAENAGMEVSQAQFDLNSASTALVRARTAIHSFSVDSVKAAVSDGLDIALAAYTRGQRALKELRFRRMGLAVSVAIILMLIVGLVLKIRELESSE